MNVLSHERLAGLAIVVALSLSFSGCGDDGSEIMEPPDEAPPRSTPSQLLTEYFKTAYTTQDTALYAAMLDSDFRFEFLEEDADNVRDFLDSANTWNRERDIGSTNLMFRDPSVTGVTMNILVIDDHEVVASGCEDCRQVETNVTLRVSTIVDGAEDPELILAVDSPQTFLVGKDPGDTTQWVLVRQVDRSESGKATIGGGAAKSAGKSWGGIKGLYAGGLAPVEPDRSTPEALLTNYFETAYTTQDSALYARILHEEFRFSFLQQDADSLREFIPIQNFWESDLDLRSTTNMFQDSTVTGVGLNISVQSNAPFMGGGCPDCRTLETFVTLRVMTTGDGTEPLIFAVDSPQTFVTAPDPARPGKWILFWQIDRSPNKARRNDLGVSDTTWGQIKGLFIK
jgi:hypothetical protein